MHDECTPHVRLFTLRLTWRRAGVSNCWRVGKFFQTFYARKLHDELVKSDGSFGYAFKTKLLTFKREFIDMSILKTGKDCPSLTIFVSFHSLSNSVFLPLISAKYFNKLTQLLLPRPVIGTTLCIKHKARHLMFATCLQKYKYHTFFEFLTRADERCTIFFDGSLDL